MHWSFIGCPQIPQVIIKIRIGIPLFFLVLASLSPARAQDETHSSRINQAIEAFLYSLEDGRVQPEQVRQLEEFIRNEDPVGCSRAIPVMSRYLNEVETSPLAAIRLVAQQILPDAVAKKWLNANRRTDRQRDKLKLKTPFPKVSTWDLSQPESCIQTARLLVLFGQYNTAIEAYEKVGRKLSGMPQVLAAEGGGDVLMRFCRYSQAVEWYNLGLKIAVQLKDSESYGRPRTDRIIALVTARMEKKKTEAEMRLEEDLYGVGFAKYKQARLLEVNKQDCLRAVIAYNELCKACPQTVYSEAATLYRAKCRFILSTPSGRKSAQSNIQSMTARMNDLRTHLTKHGNRLTSKVRSDCAVEIKEMMNILKMLRQIPLGESAARAAIQELNDFIDENEYGLYRGEALLSLGDYWLEYGLALSEGAKWYDRANEWLATVENINVSLEGFTVPGKASSVTAPPTKKRYEDAWANTFLSVPRPEAVTNRITCHYYLTQLREEAVLKKGFVRFAQGYAEEASKYWSKLHHLDSYYREQERKGFGSMVKRLLSKAQKTPGCLYATPQEMALFRNEKKRLAVLLADLSFEKEDWKKSTEMYRQLLNGRAGRLNTNQRAYITYALAQSLAYRMKDEETDKLLLAYDGEFKKTPTTPRALLMRANRALVRIDVDSLAERRGFRDYERILSEYPQTDEADCAAYYFGWKCFLSGRITRAKTRFEKYLRMYPEGIWEDAAKHYLGVCNKALSEYANAD